MTRESSEAWKCMVCGEDTINSIPICYECIHVEKTKQRNASGSVTKKQAWLIRKLLNQLSGTAFEESCMVAVGKTVNYYGVDDLSQEQATVLIFQLKSWEELELKAAEHIKQLVEEDDAKEASRETRN